jgi:HK97 family phage prohead protease
MPNVSDYDNEQDWMHACVPAMLDEGKPQDQAVAACMNIWRNRDKRYAEHKPMEYKSFVHQVKQVDGRTVTGFAAIFGNVDSGNDRTWVGAFKKTIKERGDRVRHLWQHDLTQPPIAAIRSLKEVARIDLPDELRSKFPEATGGLLVEREYLDTPRGDEVLKGIISGAVSEMSFGYDPVKYDFEGDQTKGESTVRNLRECRLWDTSDVNWGMNEATVASKKDPAILLAELLSTIKAAQGIDPAALNTVDPAALKNALEQLTTILTAERRDPDPKVAKLTEQELATLKARFDEVQRLAKLYQQ